MQNTTVQATAKKSKRTKVVECCREHVRSRAPRGRTATSELDIELTPEDEAREAEMARAHGMTPDEYSGLLNDICAGKSAEETLAEARKKTGGAREVIAVVVEDLEHEGAKMRKRLRQAFALIQDIRSEIDVSGEWAFASEFARLERVLRDVLSATRYLQGCKSPRHAVVPCEPAPKAAEGTAAS